MPEINIFVRLSVLLMSVCITKACNSCYYSSCNVTPAMGDITNWTSTYDQSTGNTRVTCCSSNLDLGLDVIGVDGISVININGAELNGSCRVLIIPSTYQVEDDHKIVCRTFGSTTGFTNETIEARCATRCPQGEVDLLRICDGGNDPNPTSSDSITTTYSSTGGPTTFTSAASSTVTTLGSDADTRSPAPEFLIPTMVGGAVLLLVIVAVSTLLVVMLNISNRRRRSATLDFPRQPEEGSYLLTADPTTREIPGAGSPRTEIVISSTPLSAPPQSGTLDTAPAGSEPTLSVCTSTKPAAAMAASLASFSSDCGGALGSIKHNEQFHSELNVASVQESQNKSQNLAKLENHHSIGLVCSDGSGSTREVVHHNNKELFYPGSKDIKTIKYIIETQTNLFTRSMSSSV